MSLISGLPRDDLFAAIGQTKLRLPKDMVEQKQTDASSQSTASDLNLKVMELCFRMGMQGHNPALAPPDTSLQKPQLALEDAKPETEKAIVLFFGYQCY